MITLNRNELSKALAIVSKAVSPKPVIPLMGNVKVEVNQEGIRLSATNFEIGITKLIPARTSEYSSTTLPAETFSKLVNAIGDESIMIGFDEQNQTAHIITPYSKNKISTVAADDFPDIPQIEGDCITINAAQFKKMVNRVSFAAKRGSEDDSPLAGVLISVHPAIDKLVMFAVDGFHLSYEEYAVTNQEVLSINSIVRATTLELISRLLDDEGELEIQATETQIRFRTGTTSVVSQVMAGKFPDYHAMNAGVMGTASTKIAISTLELLRACKQLEIFANEAACIFIETQGLIVNINSLTQERGESTANLPAIVEGNKIRIGLNVFFLHELLEVCETPTVRIEISGERAPIVFKMDNVDTFHHFILPIVS